MAKEGVPDLSLATSLLLQGFPAIDRQISEDISKKLMSGSSAPTADDAARRPNEEKKCVIHVTRLARWVKKAESVQGQVDAVLAGVTGDRQHAIELRQSLGEKINEAWSAVAEHHSRSKRWYLAHKAASKAVSAAAETALVTGRNVPGEVKSALSAAYADFMLRGNTPALRGLLADMAQRYPKEEALAAHAAKYLVMSGNYSRAHSILESIGAFDSLNPVFREVRPLLMEKPHVPWEGVSTACNYYNYQHPLVSDDLLAEMRAQISFVQQVIVPKNEPPPSTRKAGDFVQDEKIDAAKAALVTQAMAAEQVKATSNEARVKGDAAVDQFLSKTGGSEFDPATQTKNNGRNQYATFPNYQAKLSILTGSDRASRAAEEAYDFLKTKLTTFPANQQAIRIKMYEQVGCAKQVVEALFRWNSGLRQMRRRNYSAAINEFNAMRGAALSYFALRYNDPKMPAGPQYKVPADIDGIYSELRRFANDRFAPANKDGTYRDMRRKRNLAATLESLEHFDWVLPLKAFRYSDTGAAPSNSTSRFSPLRSGAELVWALGMSEYMAPTSAAGTNAAFVKVEEKIEFPLLVITLVLCSFALAECNQNNRQYDQALVEIKRALDMHDRYKILSQTVEWNFARILFARILLAKGDYEYKTQLPSTAPLKDAQGNPVYQGLRAAETYLGLIEVLRPLGGYVNRVTSELSTFATTMQGLLAKRFDNYFQKTDTVNSLKVRERSEWLSLAHVTIIRNVELPQAKSLRGGSALASPINFKTDATDSFVGERNPVVYQLITRAQARLIQLKGGLNYLGYHDDYVPPWRFEFLLQRARSFAEHAKSLQRDYLNFLRNAETEEFQEESMRQVAARSQAELTVSLARTDQSLSEVEAAKKSTELADLVKNHATVRANNYASFEDKSREYEQAIRELQGWQSASTALSALSSAAEIGGKVAASTGPAGVVLGPIAGVIAFAIPMGTHAAQQNVENIELQLKSTLREQEKYNLRAAIDETTKSKAVSDAQLISAQTRVTVAALENGASAMAQEFARQNYLYYINRRTNSELWYRLTWDVAELATRSLDRAIEVSFLAEQAYEFEADKTLNVIRFDYDAGVNGDTLGGDYLLSDLESLEQDLIVSQQLRQQEFQMTVSLARDFPEALGDLQRDETAIIPITLRYLEERFPGMFNIRVGRVDARLVALMSSNRQFIVVTHSGLGFVRANSRNVSQGNATSSWIPAVDERWPVRVHNGKVESKTYTGLPTSESRDVFSFESTSQRAQFEKRPAATTWHIEVKQRQNRFVPGSLADVVLTFVLSGYLDETLKGEIKTGMPSSTSATRLISTAQEAPDSFYEFANTGRLQLDVASQQLTQVGSPTRLRNFGVMLVPSLEQPQFSPCASHCVVEVEISSVGALTILTELPHISLSSTGLVLHAVVTLAAGVAARWKFDDNSNELQGAAVNWTYPYAGRYIVQLSLVSQGRRYEYRFEHSIAAQNPLITPLVVLPLQITVSGTGANRILAASCQRPAGVSAAASWQLADGTSKWGDSVTFPNLSPGRYFLRLSVMADLQANISCRQRIGSAPVGLAGLMAVSNRKFKDDGSLDTSNVPSPLTTSLFGSRELSPVDRWLVEFPLGVNGALKTYDRSGTQVFNGAAVQDLILTMEFDQFIS